MSCWTGRHASSLVPRKTLRVTDKKKSPNSLAYWAVAQIINRCCCYPNFVLSNWEQQSVLWGHNLTYTKKRRHPSRKCHPYWHIQMLLLLAGTNVIPRSIQELSSLHAFSGFQLHCFLLNRAKTRQNLDDTYIKRHQARSFCMPLVLRV